MQNPLPRKLFIFIYFAAIIVFPLSGVHIEIEGENIPHISETSDGDASNFIEFVHKLLCPHLGSNSEYISYPRGTSLTKGFVPKNSIKNAATNFSSAQPSSRTGFSLFLIGLLYIDSLIYNNRTKDCAGMYSSWSGLSPPPAFAAQTIRQL